MSQDGRTYANTPYTTLRVPPREDRPARTYEPDPDAVARLKAHFAREEAEREQQKLEKLARAAERVRAKRATKTVEAPAETPAKEEPVNELKAETLEEKGITPEQVAQWAAWRREGKPFGHIKRDDPARPTWPVVKAALAQHGYDQHGHKVDGSLPDEQPVHKARRSVASRNGDAPAEAPETWGDVINRENARALATAAEAARTQLPVLPAVVEGAPSASSGQAVTRQLAALQQLVSTLTASQVQVTGRIRVELVAEIAL
jgi:hypothetical protein